MREAARLLGVSERHGWRLLAAYRKEGAAAIAHGNRGREPAHALGEETRARVRELAQGRFQGVNHCHLTDLLAEHEGVVLSRSTVRRILAAAGIRSPRRRRPPQHRIRRERYPQEGMLLQVDGSRHDWLEGRGPSLTLVGAIDDATGTVPFALFREQEDAQGYFLVLEEVLRSKGIPLALYSDRHSIFQVNPKQRETLEEQLAGERQPTQVGRVLPGKDGSWGSSPSSPSPPRPRDGSNGCGGPSRTAWWRSCAWQGPAPSQRPTGCCGASCPASTPASACQRPSRAWPIGSLHPGSV